MRPLVETADMEMAVIPVTTLQRVMTRIPWTGKNTKELLKIKENMNVRGLTDRFHIDR